MLTSWEGRLLHTIFQSVTFDFKFSKALSQAYFLYYIISTYQICCVHLNRTEWCVQFLVVAFTLIYEFSCRHTVLVWSLFPLKYHLGLPNLVCAYILGLCNLHREDVSRTIYALGLRRTFRSMCNVQPCVIV